MTDRPFAPDRTATDISRLRDQITGLEVQVTSLDRGRRRTRTFGPALLLVLATYTPIIAVTTRNDPQEYFTMWQAVRGGAATGGLPSVWFVGIGALMLAVFCGCLAFLEREPARGLVVFVATAAGLLIAALVAMLVAVAGESTKSTAASGLQTATVLAVAAACWVLMTCASLRD